MTDTEMRPPGAPAPTVAGAAAVARAEDDRAHVARLAAEGEAALKAGQFAAAIAAHAELVRRRPHLIDLWRRLGVSYSRGQGMAEAAGHMAAHAVAVGHAAGFRVAAQIAAQSGDLAAATRLAEQGMAAVGADEALALLLCRLWRDRGDHARGAAAAGAAIRRGLGGDRLRLAWAHALLQADDANGALAAVAPLLAAQPAAKAPRQVEGDALQRLGDHGRELAALRQWLAADPTSEPARLRLANRLVADGRFTDAISILLRLMREQPESARFPTVAAMILYGMGKDGRGLRLAQRAVALDADAAEAQLALATILNRMARHREAEMPARRAVALLPKLSAPHNALALSLQRQNRFSEAEALCNQAISLQPDDPDALANLATLQWMLERYPQSIANFDRALAQRPGDAEIHFNRGVSHLAMGDFARAWDDLGWRWKRDKAKWRPFPQPWWTGGPVAGRIVAWGEQGVGDEVLAAGLLPDLQAAVPAGVALECDPRLVPLIRRSMPHVLVAARVDPIDPALLAPDIAAQTPMVDLARHLRPDRASFRPHSGYFRADPALTARLRARYREPGLDGAAPGLVVGLSWSSTNRKLGQRKTLELPAWAPILATPGVRFVSLQYGDVSDEVEAVRAATGVAVRVDPEIDSLVDIDAYAAQVAAMDLVITISNTAVHFAGALGVPGWLMLPRGNGLLWYWLVCQGEHCPWYPSIRVFRQDREGDWSGMVERLASALRNRAAT
ncbi:tetratricopeptide repeat protein [Stella humosa]|uniref:Tetratricopeptide repeat protein n=1 Tax=Stella humosa TaxID=94 RepID=A0A3N1MHG6_9PROT|nr:tetratricopeptide repeat protein [Stella humosa]ROQ03101.1 tetratricopeptide repeat protein [Stella humosa]BBK30185.1 hypothetical protein STHU_08190 [Stella humosa]